MESCLWTQPTGEGILIGWGLEAEHHPSCQPSLRIQLGREAKDPRGQNCTERRQVDAELALGALPELVRGGVSRKFIR